MIKIKELIFTIPLAISSIINFLVAFFFVSIQEEEILKISFFLLLISIPLVYLLNEDRRAKLGCMLILLYALNFIFLLGYYFLDLIFSEAQWFG